MKLGKFIKSAIEVYYTDRCTAFRYREMPSRDDDGTTEIRLDTINPIVESYPCRVSYVANRQEDPKDSQQDANPILTQPKIFISEKSGVKAGDYMHAFKMADDGVTVLAEYSGPIGLPFAHESHLEFQIGEVNKA